MSRGGNTAAATLVRDDLRRRWRLVVVVGVLVGLTAGSGLACLAGARRTQTSFPRHLDSSHAADVEIDPGSFDPASDAAIRALPGVEEASYWKTTSVFLLNDEGKLFEEAAGLLTITSDGRYLDMDQVSIVEGRRVDPDNPNEIMINEAMAATGDVGVGDHVPLGYFPTDPNTDFPTSDEPVDPIDAEIVGIIALNEDIVSEDLETGLQRLFFSPAYEPPGPEFNAGFVWYGLRLTDGQAGADAVINEWNEVAARHNEEHRDDIDAQQGEEWGAIVRRTEDLQTKAELAVRPLVIALATFGLALLVTVLFLGSQALTRAARQESDRLRALRQLGLDRLTLVRTSLAVPAAAAGLTVVVAFVTAWALSSRFPAGPFVELEPNPGLHLDAVVLVPGLALLAFVPVLATAAALSRSVGGLLQPELASGRSSRIAGVLARAGAPEPVSAAVRLTSPGRGVSYVPTLSVLTSTVVIVAVLVGAMVFGENLDALGQEPVRFGWSGDSLLMSEGGYGGFVPPGADTDGLPDDVVVTDDYLASRDDIDGWRLIGGDRTEIDGNPTPGIYYGPSGGSGDRFQPVLVEGHAPQAVDEIVVGRDTLAAIGKEVGDTVTLGSAGQEATIVGTAVFPVFGPLLAVKTDLGLGVWVDPEAGVFNFVGTDYGPPFNGMVLDLEPGVTTVPNNQTELDVFGVIQPIEVRTTTEATRYEPALLAALGLTGLLAILLTLVAVVRRRRFELGMYRVLGFRPRQLRATIGLQGLIFGIGALAIGVPLGVVVGRLLWRQFADTLGVLDVTEVPWVQVALAGVAVLIVAVLSAVPPAIAAGRRRDQPRDERG